MTALTAIIQKVKIMFKIKGEQPKAREIVYRPFTVSQLLRRIESFQELDINFSAIRVWAENGAEIAQLEYTGRTKKGNGNVYVEYAVWTIGETNPGYGISEMRPDGSWMNRNGMRVYDNTVVYVENYPL